MPRKPKIAPDKQLSAVRAITHDFEFVRIAARYVERHMPAQHVELIAGQPVPTLCVSVASLFRNACIEFLRRGSDATEYRKRAAVLHDAVAALLADKDPFIARMTGEDLARHALWAVDETSKALFALAREVEKDDAHAAFGFILARAFHAAQLPTPRPAIAKDVYARLTCAEPGLPPIEDARNLRRALARGASPGARKG